MHSHCRNVGKVAQALIARLSHAVRNLLPDGTATIAALHDVGKISPGFQKKYFNEHLKERSPELANYGGGFESKHAVISEASLNSWMGKHSSKISEILGSHHGKRIPSKPDNWEIYGGEKWSNERRKLIEKIVKEFGNLPVDELSVAQRNIIAGLVCIADWIGSDEEFFPSSRSIEEHEIRKVAERALDECGWTYPELIHGLSFEGVFRNTPYPVQQEFIDSLDGAGLYILEAPMGRGKTEAALYAAYKLISQGHNSGIYFGLPTRVTSNRIYIRVSEFLNAICKEKTSARLVHGQAWLKMGGGEELTSGKSWFIPRKRSLLVPFGVGTVDQALLSVLRVKHFFVRSFGLAGKIVILDEVHSYDVYTGTLLDELVQSLLQMGSTVIILSATLTKERRTVFFSDSKIPLDNSYPLISIENKTGIQTRIVDPPPSKEFRIFTDTKSTPELAELAVEKACSGNCVLWIANTVGTAQNYFRAVKSDMPVDRFPIALLHSKYPAFRRAELEEEWMEKLGKNGDRPNGCVLVATQVVEQSVDIDADFLITELAPTDMLLQRIGRLWRHDRLKRPCNEPEVFIIVGEIENTDNQNSLIEALGKGNSKVYAPYVLWRTYNIWNKLTSTLLPDDIRDLLESTYQRKEQEEPDFINELFNKLEKHRNDLREKANGVKAEAWRMPTGEDTEYAATRYSTLPQTDALLVKAIESMGNSATITLLNDKKVNVSVFERNFNTTKELYKNLVSIPSYHFPGLKTPRYLKKHIYGNVAVLEVGNDGFLRLEGRETGLCYDNEKGVYKHTEIKGGLEAVTNYSNFDAEEEYNEFD